MTYNVIATGSTGNAVTVNEEILIDCGIPYRLLEPYISPLKLVLLTHIHSDHFRPSTVAALHKARPALRWGCCPWMARPLLEAGVDKRCIDVFELGRIYRYDGICNVRPVALTHNVENCGFHLVIDGKRVFYATDTGTLSGIQARDYDLYLVEANHVQAEIEERIAQKQAAGEFAYEYAAARNHLSREQAEDWLYQNMGPNGRYVFLHGHKDHKEVSMCQESDTTG